MRFGVFIPQGWRLDLVGIESSHQWAKMRELAQKADAGPWDSLWVYDHFHTVPEPTDEATHEAWTLMAGFAASTMRIRLGQMCTCMSYRDPAYLAKVAATVDHVSGGRLEMGIGGGWYEDEWRAYGYGFPVVGERLARLREGVEIMSQAWTTGRATLNGKHYQVDGAIVRPLPVQARGIPIWVAGAGEKVTLRIAAKYAQYTNFAAGDVEVFQRKSDILRQHCMDLGTDFDAITRSSEWYTIVGATEAEVSERLRALESRFATVIGDRARTALDALDGTMALVGTPEQIVEKLTEAQRLGSTYGIHYFPESAWDRSGVELFEREVIPVLRDA